MCIFAKDLLRKSNFRPLYCPREIFFGSYWPPDGYLDSGLRNLSPLVRPRFLWHSRSLNWEYFSNMTDTLRVPPEDIFASWKRKFCEDLQASSTPSQSLSMRIRKLRNGNPDLKLKNCQHEISDAEILLPTDLL